MLTGTEPRQVLSAVRRQLSAMPMAADATLLEERLPVAVADAAEAQLANAPPW